MIQEEKDLLLKDLCARLPYGVICEDEYGNVLELNSIDKPNIVTFKCSNNTFWTTDLDKCKPYLFPLSSMTEEQKEELFYNYIHNDIYFDDFTDYFLAGELWHDICVSMDALPALITWLNKNHFDYNNLIPKGLAIDATGLNIY